MRLGGTVSLQVVGALAAIAAGPIYLWERAFDLGSGSVQGTVTELHRGQNRWKGDVEYEVGGVSYTIPTSFRRRSQSDAVVTVRYDENDPQDARVENDIVGVYTGTTTAVVLAGLAGVATLLKR